MVLSLLLALALAGAPTDARAVSPGSACRLALKKGIAPLEKLPMPKRVQPALALLARACPAELGDLASIASSAAGTLDRDERAKGLGQAATSLPAACQTKDPTAPAGPLLRACPSSRLGLDESIGKDLNAGTYVFVLAVERRLQSADAFDDAAQRVLSILVLSAAFAL